MIRENQLQYLKEEFSKINRELSEKQLEQFVIYYEMLVEKNKVMNLTAITEFEEVVQKHFVDSIMLSENFIKDGESLIDVGTGAGFPGIPLKIVYPNLQVVLLDSLNKRVKFLNEVIDELGLEKIEAIHSRAEDGGRNPKLREQFTYAVSRAVANLATLSEYCMPFVKVGGAFISYKSGKIEEELSNAEGAIKKLGGKIKDKVLFELPDSDMSRSLIAIEKVEKIKSKYPRKAGLPSKEPLN